MTTTSNVHRPITINCFLAVLPEIGEYLNLKETMTASRVCKTWQCIFTNPIFLKPLASRSVPSSFENLQCVPIRSINWLNVIKSKTLLLKSEQTLYGVDQRFKMVNFLFRTTLFGALISTFPAGEMNGNRDEQFFIDIDYY